MSWVILEHKALFHQRREKEEVRIHDMHLFVCPIPLAHVLVVNGQGLQHLFDCGLVRLVRTG